VVVVAGWRWWLWSDSVRGGGGGQEERSADPRFCAACRCRVFLHPVRSRVFAFARYSGVGCVSHPHSRTFGRPAPRAFRHFRAVVVSRVRAPRNNVRL
jgi:hypothetical protein